MDGKISRIDHEDGSGLKELEFVYDAMGQRIAKKVFTDTHQWESTTYYIRDAQGNVMSTYEHTVAEGSASLKLSEQHLYGSSRIGMRTPELEMIGAQAPDDLGKFSIVRGLKRYELTNHLGNVLSVITDTKQAVYDNPPTVLSYYQSTIISYTDYYPFGAPMDHGSSANDRSWSGGYRYGFNGKEKDDEGMGGGLSTYDYGFRIYNPALGRFLSVDPLTASYPWYTPYQFAGNKPIWCIDLDGLEELDYNDFLQGLRDGYDLLLEVPFPEVNEQPAGGPTGTWKINEDNQFWTLSGKTYSMRDGVSPSEALMDFVENPQNYTIDCAQFVQLQRLYAMHNSMGDEEFDAYIEKQRGNFEINQHKSTGINSYKTYSRGRDGNMLPKGGRMLRSLRENAFYNKLPIGSRLWIGSKGYEPSEYNGENIIKVGKNRYNAQGIGENMTLRQIKRALKKAQTPVEGKKQSISVEEVEIYKGNIKE